jgi:2TM family of unknown function (DUF5676)
MVGMVGTVDTVKALTTGSVVGMKEAATTPIGPKKRRRRLMLNTKVITWSLGLFGALTFVVCVLYGLIVPETLHMTGFLEQVLPGFTWLTWLGFFIGTIESFLYGVYAGLAYCTIHNVVARRLS